MKNVINRIFAVFMFSVLALIILPTASQAQKRQKSLGEQVRKELVTLPYYGVFDNLAYKIDGGQVTLYGQVVRPTTRKDAANRVGDLNGVTSVASSRDTGNFRNFR